jgi:hypothetical protein
MPVDPAQPAASPADPSGTAVAIEFNDLEVARREAGESALKWTWLAATLFALSLLLPAASSGSEPSDWRVQGWQAAVATHSALWEIPVNLERVNRAAAPLTAFHVYLVALTGAAANWCCVGAMVCAYMGAGDGSSSRAWRIGARLALIAGVLAALIVTIWFTLRGITPLWGTFLWILSPFVLATGLSRAARRAAQLESETAPGAGGGA